ncbi:bacterial extracellular solute-binding family protein [Burkholderia pseudomallei 576]|nr:bacterial extracellular solute-binding family protein [Burkholderia pseudomallei 576]EEC35612.1 oligopeptide ABC transporter, oligopeptide-binding protein [Burkholderia pseudomallei 576]KGD28269.1 bacterial extracellular solute-binding family protein [Burkholderia pseudomallei]VBT26257.1 ABC transporter substrate-binding protein [Burkholderia pseudomallei]
MNSKSVFRQATLMAVCATAFAAAGAQAADSIVFTSWGGTTQSSQDKDWAKPFTKATGINVMMDGPTDYGKLKAMVDSGNVTWDVVDVEGDFAYAAQKAGLIEPIDYSVVKKDELDPRFVSPAAVGSFYYAFVLGFNKASFKGAQPSAWADLFDTKRFPGKRTFYKWSAPGVLEIALLADGVPVNKLYPLDLDRAFKKLDSIKSDIVWWGGGAQSQQLLASGEAPICWRGRLPGWYSCKRRGRSTGR